MTDEERIAIWGRYKLYDSRNWFNAYQEFILASCTLTRGQGVYILSTVYATDSMLEGCVLNSSYMPRWTNWEGGQDDKV